MKFPGRIIPEIEFKSSTLTVSPRLSFLITSEKSLGRYSMSDDEIGFPCCKLREIERPKNFV